MSESISFILPVYNAEKHLAQCIESVLSLKDSIEWELVIVDDGSKDSSAAICDQFAKMDSHVRVLHVENGGVSRARNLGLQNAQKEVVTFIDADDWIDAIAFVKAFHAYVLFDAELGYVPFFSVENGRSRIVPLSVGEDRLLSLEDKDYILKKRLGAGIDFYGYVWRCFFSRKLVEKIEFNTSLKYNEDVLFCLETLYKAKKVAVINLAYYYYRVNPEQHSISKGTYSLKNRIAGWNKIKEWAAANHIDFDFALMRRHCPIYARMFALIAMNHRGFKRAKALWKVHCQIPKSEIRQWKMSYWGKSFAPYVLSQRFHLGILGYFFLLLRFF